MTFGLVVATLLSVTPVALPPRMALDARGSDDGVES